MSELVNDWDWGLQSNQRCILIGKACRPQVFFSSALWVSGGMLSTVGPNWIKPYILNTVLDYLPSIPCVFLIVSPGCDNGQGYFL